MPTIYSTGRNSSPLLDIKTLQGENPETTRADAGNQTVTASDYILINRSEQAINALTEPTLNMPYKLANLLVQAALHFKAGVTVDFETKFSDPITMNGSRSYINFRKS